MSKKLISVILAVVMMTSLFTLFAFAGSLPDIQNVEVKDNLAVKFDEFEGAAAYDVWVYINDSKFVMSDTVTKGNGLISISGTGTVDATVVKAAAKEICEANGLTGYVDLSFVVNAYNADGEKIADSEFAKVKVDTSDYTVVKVCEYCGQVHVGFFGSIIKFFHNIIIFFRNLFSKIGTAFGNIF